MANFIYPFSLLIPIFIGFEAWSSATPQSIKYFVLSQSGSPNSQNENPVVYKPAAAIFTEQNPPCAAVPGKVISEEDSSAEFDLLVTVPPHKGMQVIEDNELGKETDWINY